MLVFKEIEPKKIPILDSENICLYHTGIGKTQYIATSRLRLFLTVYLCLHPAGKESEQYTS